MPLYCYRCPECGQDDTVFQGISQDRRAPRCSCGTEMDRDFQAEAPGPPRPFATPIQMFSIACNTPEEIAQLRSAAPGVEVSDDPSDPLYGVPIARDRQQKLQALDAIGWEEKS